LFLVLKSIKKREFYIAHVDVINVIHLEKNNDNRVQCKCKWKLYKFYT